VLQLGTLGRPKAVLHRLVQHGLQRDGQHRRSPLNVEKLEFRHAATAPPLAFAV
jgi:hypothetical protein